MTTPPQLPRFIATILVGAFLLLAGFSIMFWVYATVHTNRSALHVVPAAALLCFGGAVIFVGWRALTLDVPIKDLEKETDCDIYANRMVLGFKYFVRTKKVWGRHHAWWTCHTCGERSQGGGGYFSRQKALQKGVRAGAIHCIWHGEIARLRIESARAGTSQQDKNWRNDGRSIEKVWREPESPEP